MKNIFILLLIFMVAACGDNTIISPKPRTFPRVDYPEKEYRLETFADCSFQAEVPVYSTINQVTGVTLLNQKALNDCWYNIDFPELNATLYLSYVPISGYDEFEKFRDDTYLIVSEINRNSSYMAEIPFTKGKGTGGVIFDFEGAAASPYQFYITDTLSENVRGSLYINSEVRLDSLAPVVQFLEKDVQHFINTFHWKENL